MSDINTPASGGAKPPAGFYPDEAGRQRWWDGESWTDHYQAATTPTVAEKEPKKKKKKVFLWFFMIVQVLFLVWIFAGIGSSGTADDCGSLSQETCQDAQDVGTGIGVFLVIVFWIMVDFLLAVTYGIYRLARRN